MNRRVIKRAAAGVALLLACAPTEPCACPPMRTSVIVYGEVRSADGALAAGAALEYLLALPTYASQGGDVCEFDPTRNEAEPNGTIADATGRFRTRIFSAASPATRCLQVTASAAAGTARVDGLLVPFRDTRPDSVGLVLTLR